MTATQEKPKAKKKNSSSKKSGPKKIPLTHENFCELMGFVGTKEASPRFREVYGEQEEMWACCPPNCPHCASDAGYDLILGPLNLTEPRYLRWKDCLRQNRVYQASCIHCSGIFKVTEVWDIF